MKDPEVKGDGMRRKSIKVTDQFAYMLAEGFTYRSASIVVVMRVDMNILVPVYAVVRGKLEDAQKAIDGGNVEFKGSVDDAYATVP